MLSHETRDFVWMMRLCALIQLAVAALFFFKPDEVLYIVNIGPRVFKLWDEIPNPSDHFWLTIASSAMIMRAYACGYLSFFPRVKGMMGAHFISQAFVISGLALLFSKQKIFAYALGAGADLVALFFLLIFFARSIVAAPPVAASPEPATGPSHGAI